MIDMVEALSEKLALVGYISTSAGFTSDSKSTNTIDMDLFRRAIIILQGHPATSARASTHGKGLALSIYDATNTGKMATTALISGTDLVLTASSKGYQSIYEVRSEQLGKVTARTGTGRFFRARVVAGTLKCIANVVVLGDTARYGPASDDDLASVAEIKTS